MTDDQIKDIAEAINPDWWNDDIDLLDFTRAVLARAGQKQPSSGESHEDSLKSCDEALRLADALGHAPKWQQLQAAAELRRLHDENEALRAMSFDTKRSIEDEALLRQALEALDELKYCSSSHAADDIYYETIAALKERLK